MGSSWRAIRFSAGLASLCVSVFFIACALGFFPIRDAAVIEARHALVESLAANAALATQSQDLEAARSALRSAIAHYPNLISAGLRAADGRLLVDVNFLAEQEHSSTNRPASPDAVTVPIVHDGSPWGTLELRFAPLDHEDWLAPGSISSFFLAPLALHVASSLSVRCFGTARPAVMRAVHPTATPSCSATQRRALPAI